MSGPRRVSAACAAAYVAITAVFARDLLPRIGAVIAGDEGDPLFVAAILHWNATRIPLTEAWWQFPIFAPTRDAITFSEHFLGLTPLAAPLHWIARDPVITYNVVTLLTFPLCAIAMFALVRRLTGNAPAAFLAGLAFAFAPYRISQIPHLQMLAFFWAPLALLGLHGYVDTGRRRWLALYGVAWMLQSATNLYALVFLSVLIAFWVLWFVVARRKWRALLEVSVATLVAALPLAPVVIRYVTVHAMHGFTRDPWEVRGYSADVAAVLCAPWNLTFWAWVQVACKPEGQLFPGAAAAVLALVAAVRVARAPLEEGRAGRFLTLLSRSFFIAGGVFALVAAGVAGGGGWGFDAGPVRISASSPGKPVLLSVACFLVTLAFSPGLRRAAASASAAGFYVAAAVFTWILALGPVVTLMGVPRVEGPFALLLALPGVTGLRVPARFWLLTTLCLGVLVGFSSAALLRGRRRTEVAGGVVVLSAFLLADGWIGRFPSGPLPPAVPDPGALKGATVVQLPMGFLRDIAAEFLAVTGGWRLVNGYSGYAPKYYLALLDAAREEEPAVVLPFLARGDLHAVVADEATRLRSLIESQPGVRVVRRGANATQYRIPARPGPPAAAPGPPIAIAALSASCETVVAARAADGDEQTLWQCGPQRPGDELVADLGRVVSVASVAQSFGEYHTNYPRHLLVETSTDGTRWQGAWDGSIRALLISQALERPREYLQVVVPFAARPARYVRLRQAAPNQPWPWSIAELEIRASAADAAVR